MEQNKKICAMCKYLTFHDDTSSTGRCGKYDGSIVNLLDTKLCFSDRFYVPAPPLPDPEPKKTYKQLDLFQ